MTDIDNPRVWSILTPGAQLAGFINSTTKLCYIQNTEALKLVDSEKVLFFIVSLWELSVVKETTILIQSAPKPIAVRSLTKCWFTLNLIKIGPQASEILFFEIVDEQKYYSLKLWTNGQQTITELGYTPSSPDEPLTQVC